MCDGADHGFEGRDVGGILRVDVACDSHSGPEIAISQYPVNTAVRADRELSLGSASGAPVSDGRPEQKQHDVFTSLVANRPAEALIHTVQAPARLTDG